MFAALAAGLASCSDDNPWASEAGTGGLKLHLRADSEVTDARPQTRAQGLTAPSASDFSIRLEKMDGSFSQTWPLLSDFDAEDSFSTGAYTLTAFYGNPEEEGFDKPYFEGTTQVTVLEQRLTEAELTATLANTMVSIDYTDAFKKYFSDYKTTVHSEGHTYVEIPKEEIRPAFIAPGEVDLTVEFTKPNGKSAKVQPASFAALARHHYHITFDVNGGNVGEAQLTIIFDDTLAQEDVTIDLTDELFSSPAPSIKPVGFTDGQQLELLSYTAPENPLKFTVIAYGGLSEAMLTISSADYAPAFGKEINLVGATPAQQQQIADAGIKVIGLFKNPDKMASVDISGLIAKLPAGDYEISMMAKDSYTRVSDPISVKFTSVPLQLTATPQMGVFGTNQAIIEVAYNGSNPKEDITYQAMNRNGVYVAAAVTSCQETTRTRSIPVRNYLMGITLPDAEREDIPVKVFLKGKEVAQLTVRLVQPEYSLQHDDYSTYSVIKVNTTEPDMRASVTNALRLYMAAGSGTPTGIGSSQLRRDTEHGFIYITGLTPSTQYTLKASLTSDMSNTKDLSLSTENAAAIPNGDFSQVHETINIGSIQTGGQYTGTIFSKPKYPIHSSIVRSEADGWASINAKTCWTGSANMNTWFCIPSTWVDGGIANIQSVGFNHNGSEPSFTKETGVYYSKNAPSFGDANRASGELFLGSYSFNGTESRTDGIVFASRPQSITFDYSYAPYGNENGLAYIALTAADGTIVASGTMQLTANSQMTTKTISLGNYAFGKKATGIQVRFLSTGSGVPGLNIPSGTALRESAVNAGNFTRPPVISANNYAAKATGTLLRIDNVKLNY